MSAEGDAVESICRVLREQGCQQALRCVKGIYLLVDVNTC